MWQNIVHFMMNTLRTIGDVANWLVTPLSFSVDLGVLNPDIGYLPPIFLEITPINFLTISSISLLLVVHLIKLFDPFGG